MPTNDNALNGHIAIHAAQPKHKFSSTTKMVSDRLGT